MQTANRPGQSANVRALVIRGLCVALFLFALISTWRTAWMVSTGLLDSDTCSELVLAEKLSREGGIMSDTWIYSTELEVVNVQIIYSLLFRLTSDWSLVRFLGTVILHCLMLGAYGYLAKQVRMKLNAFLVSASAMLLPFSMAYGRDILYHTFYIIYVILAMWIVGLYLSSLDKTQDWQGRLQQGKHPDPRTVLKWLLPIILLALVSFISGLGGLRMLMNCAAPLAAASLLWVMTGETGEKKPRSFLLPVGLAVGAAACCAAGYLINTNVLAKSYRYMSFDAQTVSLVEVTRFDLILKGLMTDLGFEAEKDLFTLQGMLSVAAALLLILVPVLSVHTLRHTKDPMARFLQLYMLTGITVLTCVFAFTGHQYWYYEVYYIPLVFWMIPALGKMEIEIETETSKKDPVFSAHTLLALLCCGILLANGVFHMDFFRNPESMMGEVAYSGLAHTDPTDVPVKQPMADYLKREGYDLCYAKYWDAAITTELTDGKVRNVPIRETGNGRIIEYYPWLVDTKLWDPEACRGKKACLIADYDLGMGLEEATELLENLEEKESFGAYTVYEVKDPALMAGYL